MVEIAAVFVTLTPDAVPPLPLPPPRFTVSAAVLEAAPPKLLPPLPPLPPKDCATIPEDITPDVRIMALLLTVTIAESPPAWPLPPKETLPAAEEAIEALPANPPLPPLPPIDCAKIPFDWSFKVMRETPDAVLTPTVPAVPPPPPPPPRATLADAVPLPLAETLKPPLPPEPPMD